MKFKAGDKVIVTKTGEIWMNIQGYRLPLVIKEL